MKLMLRNCRINYPVLFEPKGFQGSEPKFSAEFLIHAADQSATNKQIQTAISQLMDDARVKVDRDRMCYRREDKPGLEDYFKLKASSKFPPVVMDRATKPLRAGKLNDEALIYSGCFVNASVSLWLQNNSFGKRINANLLGVQFVEDGENLAGGGLTAEDVAADFSPIADSEPSAPDSRVEIDDVEW